MTMRKKKTKQSLKYKTVYNNAWQKALYLQIHVYSRPGKGQSKQQLS